MKQKSFSPRKFAWIATEIKNGWRLSLDVSGSKRKFNLAGLVVKTPDDVLALIGNKASVLFIHLANTKFPVKE